VPLCSIKRRLQHEESGKHGGQPGNHRIRDDAKSEISVLKGKDDLNGEIWKVKWDGSGLSRASGGTLPLLYNPNYFHSRTQSQFDVSPMASTLPFRRSKFFKKTSASLTMCSSAFLPL